MVVTVKKNTCLPGFDSIKLENSSARREGPAFYARLSQQAGVTGAVTLVFGLLYLT